MTVTYCFEPLFGEADGYDGEGYDANGADRDGYDRDGNPKNVCAEDLNLADLWGDFESSSKPAFRAFLRSITRNPAEIDSVVFCVNSGCGAPAWEDETSQAGEISTDRLCEPCADSWVSCAGCASKYPDGDLITALNGDDTCANCLGRDYTYCEYCEGYYADEYEDEHDHDDEDGCGCVSPQESFTVRNDGAPPLANDTRVTVTLPAGIISAPGLDAIKSYLRQELNVQGESTNLVYDLAVLGDLWQDKRGNYPKRLSRFAYTVYGVRLSPKILAQVGCIARDNSGSQSSYVVEVTRDLNLSAEDFYHEGSCWWTDYKESRCALKTNGGFGLRTFSSEYGFVSGRAWVMPLRRMMDYGMPLGPTFDTETPDAFMVFNGYGDLSEYAAARIMAHMTGWTYRKTSFECEPMYINGKNGYLVAPEDIAGEYESKGVYPGVSAHADLFSDEQAARTEKETVHVA
ncbi:MAG TPA: hypothetical protein VGG75_13610 [Trebonia sp.]|jgi:hypothetical protein